MVAVISPTPTGLPYKINVRTPTGSWLNLLQSKYVEHDYTVTGIGTSATTNVEQALKYLFDNKVPRIESASAPTSTDDSYQVGAIWVDTTNDVAYVCLDNTAGNAIWHSTGLTVEETQDIVGDMVTGNVENGIVVSYDDVSGKLNFDVNDPVITLQGDVNGSATLVNLSNMTITTTISGGYYKIAEADSKFVDVAGDTMTGPLAINSTLAVSAGTTINEFSTDGTLSGNSDTAIPTEQAVKSYVDARVTGLDWQDSVLDKDLNDPPTSPNVGDRYITSAPPASATGDWAGHDNEIAEWDGSAWQFTPVSEGMATWVEDEDVQYVYNGTEWAKIGTTITHNNMLGLQGGTAGVTGEYFHLTSAEHSSITGAKAANTVFAAPDGASGVGSFRSLVPNDIPTLTSAKISDFEEAAQDAFGVLVANGSQNNIIVTYDDANNSVNYSVSLATAASASNSVNSGLASFSDSQFSVDSNGFVELQSWVTDHGSLSGLADDDHLQYVHISNARTITAQHTFNVSTGNSAPFAIGNDSKWKYVEGLNADLVDGQHWLVSDTDPTLGEHSTQPFVSNDVWIQTEFADQIRVNA